MAIAESAIAENAIASSSTEDAGGGAATVTRFHTDDISRGAALGASSSLDGALVT